MTSHEPRGRKVVDPKPVRPHYETRTKLSSGSEKVWEETNKPKSVLRRAEFNLCEVDHKPASNINTMSVQIDKVPKFYIDEHSVKEQIIVDKRGQTSHLRSKLPDGKRKIVRSEDRYREEDFEFNGLKSRKRSPLREPNAMNRSDESPLHSYSSMPTRAPFADHMSDAGERHRRKYEQSERDDIFRREHCIKSSKASSCDADASSAVCDANVKFLNDFSIVDSNGHSEPSQLTKVTVTVPSVLTSSSYSASLGAKKPGARNGYSEHDRSSNLDQARKLVHGRRKLKDILSSVDPNDEGLQRIREQIKKQRDAINGQERGEELDAKSHVPELLHEPGIRNGYAERDRNGSPDQFSKLDPGRRTLKDILRTVDPNDEGLQRIRERIKKQKDAMNGQEIGEELDTKVPELPQRTLHKPDEPVQGHKYDIYIGEPPPIPARKVATGCRVPSYRGFSETETLRESSSRHGRVPEGRRKTSKSHAQPHLQPAAQPAASKHHSQENRRNGDYKPEEGKKLTRVVAQKHPTKSEVITTHSWREGQKAIIKELGPQKMPKISALPPTTDEERKTEHCSKHAKKLSTKEHLSPNEHSQMALSAEAQSVLADLHDAQSDDENSEDRGKGHRRSSRHKRSRTPEKDLGDKPQAKVRHYDSNEVRKYIAKQRAEKKRKQQEEEEMSKKREEARKKMLKEVYKKQKARARAAQPKSDNIQYRIDPPDSKQKVAGESDKENFSGDSSSSSTITEPSGERKKPSFEIKPAWQKQSVNTEILLRKFLGSSATDSSHSDFTRSSMTKPVSGQLDPDAHVKAGEIVKQITEESGLSVDEIVSKYARQAEAIKSTFTQPDLFPHSDKILAPKHNMAEVLLKKTVQPTKGVSAKLDRIQAIKNTASSLQTRLQLEAQRLASAVPLVADKWNQPKDEPEFVSRYQQLIGQPVTGFDGDLPGVTNLHSFAEKLEREGAKTDAAIKIQAAFRGHNVRQSLAWRYPEHKMVGSKHKLHKSHKDQHITDLDVLSDSTLTEDSLPEDSQHKKLSAVPPYVPARGIKPSKPVPAWDQQTSDPYTFYSVYSRKNVIHKPRIPTPPLSDDDDEEMRELTEPPPPPPVLCVPMPSKIRKPRATSPGSMASDTASSVEEDLHHSDRYKEDFTTSHRSQRGKSSSERTHSSVLTGHHNSRDDDEIDDEDTLNRTLTESTSSEMSRKGKDHSQSQSLVLSSKDKVDKESDWSDVSSLTDESYSAFQGMNGQAKPAYKKMNYNGNQWSPGVLHHHLAMELNYLDGTEELLQQVTNIDRTLGIAVAQQETVSLAQVIKAHQQTHGSDLADLQHKTQQETQQRAAQASRNMNLISAKSTGLNSFPREDRSTQYSLHEQSQYLRTNSQYSGTEDQVTSYSSQSYESNYTKSSKMPSEERKKSTDTGANTSSSSTSTIKTGTISTASDVSGGRKSADSSIHTESGVRDEAEISKTESIPEDIGDYTADFDTEEELECSLREMLPSEGQRKQLKRQTSKDLSLFSDDSQFPGEDQGKVFSHRLSFEDDSFSRYNVDMVRKYLQDDETRERHHHAILKLREQALVEKTKAELAWLEQQKKHIKSKGADDAYPRLKQKERGIIRRLKKEQAELKRLQEVQRAASRQRLMMLKESQEIVKMQKSAQRLRKAVKACQLGKHEKVYKWLIRQPLVAADQVREKLKEPVMTDISLSELMNDVQTDDDIDTGTESQPGSPSKEKSDSEIAESFHKLKLMKLDTKFMTQRERKLQQRRELASLEKQKQKSSRRSSHNAKDRYEMKEGSDTLQLTTPRTLRTESIQESIHTEKTDNSRYSSVREDISAGTPNERKSTYTSISEELSTATPSTVKKSQYTSIQERLSAAPSSIRTKSCLNTAADSSVREETQNETEANISANIDYSNATFESEPVQTHSESRVSKTKDTSSAVTTAKPVTYTENGQSVTTPHMAPNTNITKNSESESEESFSVAASASETSDTSDLKARIRELSEELKRRKIEAERLKRQHQQKQKEKLRQKEEYLRKQIENYDNYISHVRTELNHGPETPERQGSPVRPQIKPRSHAVTKTTERPKSVDKGRHDLEPSSAAGAAPSGTFDSSKEKPSVPQEEEPDHDILQSSHSKSHDITRSISEELIEEEEEEAEEPSVEKSELKLDLQAKEEDKNQATTPRSIQESRLDTARSVTEIPEDLSILTDRSEKSHHVSPRLEDIVESPRQLSSKCSEAVDENSEASEMSHTDKSASYRTESYTSTGKSKSYSDDYSDESESSTTISTHTPRSNALSDKSAGQTSNVMSAAEPPKSIHTQDDISESLAEESQSGDESKSEVFFKLTETPQVSRSDTEPELLIGDRVRVGEKVGTVRFLGFVKFAPGLHVGVSLDKPDGGSDGTVEGVTYFKCEPGHGLMTSIDNAVKVDEELHESVHDDVERSVSSKATSEVVEGQGRDITEEASIRSNAHEETQQEEELPSEKEEFSYSESIKQQSSEVSISTDKEFSNKVVKEKQREKVTDLAVQRMLDEAISQMMDIRSRKRVLLQEASKDQLQQEPMAVDSEPAQNVSEPVEKDIDAIGKDSETVEKVPESVQKGSERVDIDSDQVQRPDSPQHYRNNEFPDEDLYDFNNDVDDPWNDDDLGFGVSLKTSTSPPGIADTDELKLDLSKLNEAAEPEQVLYVVPHKEDEVCKLVSSVVDLFWERRRYGESWHDVEPPTSYYTADENGSETDLVSKRLYKRLVFNLTAHVLRDMYEDEDDDVEQPPWIKQCLPKFRHGKRAVPPTTVDALKPIVRRRVTQLLGLGADGEADRSQIRKWNTRRKKDRVDQILVQELREDEPHWVNYDDDELAVKMQLTDTLFESLVDDTVASLKPALVQWSQKRS